MAGAVLKVSFTPYEPCKRKTVPAAGRFVYDLLRPERRLPKRVFDMSCSNFSELQKSNSDIASYAMNCFYIRASANVDLDPEIIINIDGSEVPSGTGADEIEPEKMSPWAVSVHAHEYIHYLHNISTVAGVFVFIARITLLRAFKSSADEVGYSRGNEALNEEQRKDVISAIALMKAILGVCPVWPNGEPVRKPVTWVFSDPVRTAISLHPSNEIKLEVASIAGKAFDKKNNEFPFSMQIGYRLITEGVAYEVEREIRRNGGAPPEDLDTYTTPYPYLAYGALVEHLLGRPSSARERIYIGVFALQSNSPSVRLVDICNERKKLNQDELDDSRLRPLPLRKGFYEETIKPLDIVLNGAKGSGNGYWGGDAFRALFSQALTLRSKRNMLEFDLIDRALDKEAFQNWLGEMVDCCVLQKKRNGAVSNYWIGPGTVAKTDLEGAQLGGFQASLHFAGAHNDVDGTIIATREIVTPKPCPYSGACVVEVREGMPEECRTQPWKRHIDAPLNMPTCWYASGVRAFRRQPTKSDAPDGNEVSV